MARWLILFLVFASPSLVADTRSEITSVLDYFEEIWNENDIEAIQGYYHPDFVLVNDSGALTREQQIDRIRSLVNDGGDRGELDHSDLVVRELGDSHALAYGHLALKFEDGSSLAAWFSTVFEKTPFGWKALLTRN
jgi:ketosteroid isomerase-like protein